ncbi:hypothetical protein YC2023_055611 [Brassica napus]|uniref:Uncharacterized protein n=2 Tax=Brassica TaxID=3705 RepID=A0A3P6CRW4_BRAOL|nr:unnamed protein product [Brassica napus]VDD15414.1 unnamed protein product [Brassica oleracea]
MEGIDEVAPPSATGEDFSMEKKQWVLGQHRTRNLVVLDKYFNALDVDNLCVSPFGKLVKISEKLSKALDKSILGEEVEEDEMLMVLQITIICLSGKLAFK